uniref:Uncharacterized protein n=1 Tax=viral metagenome TaxID=1070528 RepID=A0A6C0E4S8_9ZZZZ
MNYVYCIPKGGFNDNLCVINRALEYCKKHNRILLVDTINSTYKVDFGIYFTFKYHNLICDSEKIREFLYEKKITIYPSILNDKMNDILNNSIEFTYSKQGFTYKSIITCLPSSDVSENIVVFVACGGGDGYSLFKSIIFKPKIQQLCKVIYERLKKTYIAIQIRNTDYKCDYDLLYENNKDEINSANEIYIATDDKKALDFFIDKGLSVKNFTTYPKEDKYTSLHYSDVDHNTKFIDMLSDIYICGMSDKLISSSVGGFINLIKSCNKNKSELAKQFERIDE